MTSSSSTNYHSQSTDKISEEVFLYHSDRRVTDDDIRVFDSAEITLDGKTYTAEIIGYSHRLYSNDDEFCEVLSSEPIGDDVWMGNITDTYSTEVKTNCGNMTVRTEVRVTQLDEFSPSDEYLLCYKFAEDAYTSIKKISHTAYKTYHTYPEYDCCIITVTEIS